MKILIDIGHPAHVHYYRNLAGELEKLGHEVIWTAKDMPVIRDLLELYGIDYILLPEKSDTISGKILKQLEYNYLVYNICRKNKINIAVGTSVSIVYASKLSGTRSIVFDDDDDEVQPLVTKYVNPFAGILVSPDTLKGKRKRKDTIYYPGYHELAYLHPSRFVPDKTVLSEAGVTENLPYFVLRFNAFKAHHDKKVMGLSINQKVELIKMLECYGRVFITTERTIEPEISKYRLEIKANKIHSLIYFSKLFIGDSQTMASEAAMLGVPALRCNSLAFSLSYLNELEQKYGLTFSFLPEDFTKMLTKASELLTDPNLGNEWENKRNRMLSDKIDVTSFWSWLILTDPESVRKIQFTSAFFQQFK